MSAVVRKFVLMYHGVPVQMEQPIDDLLDDLEAYLDNRADVDEPEPGHQSPNQEKRLLDRLREARA